MFWKIIEIAFFTFLIKRFLGYSKPCGYKKYSVLTFLFQKLHNDYPSLPPPGNTTFCNHKCYGICGNFRQIYGKVMILMFFKNIFSSNLRLESCFKMNLDENWNHTSDVEEQLLFEKIFHGYNRWRDTSVWNIKGWNPGKRERRKNKHLS